MLLEGTRAMRIAIAIGGAALAWVAIYVAFNAPVRARLGGAAHGITFLALFAAICSAIVVFMLRRWAKVRADLTGGAGFANWRVDRADWDAFARVETSRATADNRAGLWLILGFAVVIPGGLALLGIDPNVLAVIAVALAALGGVGFLLADHIARTHRRYRDGVVAIGSDGALVNGVVYGWNLPGAFVVDARVDEASRPVQLIVVYVYRTRRGEQSVTVRAPVPNAALETARLAVTRLKAVARDATGDPAVESR
jgi:hypothetical protein